MCFPHLNGIGLDDARGLQALDSADALGGRPSAFCALAGDEAEPF